MLFYTPGLISLMVVPVLFYILQPSIKTQTVIKFVVPKDDYQSPNRFGFTRSAAIAALKGKKINTVYLDENHGLNTRKLEFITREALKQKFYHDTTQVIKVRLSAETTYGEFVQLVNIMIKDGHKRYGLLDNDFYIFGEEPPEPPKPQKSYIICGSYNNVIHIQKIKTWQERYSSFITNNALLLSAFVLLIIVPVILKRKTCQVRKSL